MNLLKLHTETELQAISQYSSALFSSSSSPFDLTSTLGLLPPPPPLLACPSWQKESPADGTALLTALTHSEAVPPFQRHNPRFPMNLKKMDFNLAHIYTYMLYFLLFTLFSLEINTI